jgi:hypothetical protein
LWNSAGGEQRAAAAEFVAVPAERPVIVVVCVGLCTDPLSVSPDFAVPVIAAVPPNAPGVRV